MATRPFEIRGTLEKNYPDVYSKEALAALEALAHLDTDRKEVMTARIERRMKRARNKERIAFLDPNATIARTSIKVQDARNGNFEGSEIPHDLRRQWIQGTGPAAKPNSPTDKSIRNIAYALLSGADGWMFDGEDALGQVDSMSLDNQRNRRTGSNDLRLGLNDDAFGNHRIHDPRANANVSSRQNDGVLYRRAILNADSREDHRTIDFAHAQTGSQRES